MLNLITCSDFYRWQLVGRALEKHSHELNWRTRFVCQVVRCNNYSPVNVAARLQTKRGHYTPIQSSHYSQELLHAAHSFLKADRIFILAFERIWKKSLAFVLCIDENRQSASDRHRLDGILVAVQAHLLSQRYLLIILIIPEPFPYFYLQMLLSASWFFVDKKNQRVYLMHINIHAAQPRLSALSSQCHTAPASFQNYQKRHRQATRHH